MRESISAVNTAKENKPFGHSFGTGLYVHVKEDLSIKYIMKRFLFVSYNTKVIVYSAIRLWVRP